MRCQEHRHGFLSGCISILVVYQFFPFSAGGIACVCLSRGHAGGGRKLPRLPCAARPHRLRCRRRRAAAAQRAAARSAGRPARSLRPLQWSLCRSCSCSAAPSSASAMRTASAACSRTLREARGRIVFPFSRGSARCSRRADGGSMCQSALPYPRRVCSSAPRSPAGHCASG